MTSTPILLPPQIQRQLGRQLAALYDSLPPPPAEPRLTVLLQRLAQASAGTADKPVG